MVLSEFVLDLDLVLGFGVRQICLFLLGKRGALLKIAFRRSEAERHLKARKQCAPMTRPLKRLLLPL